MENLTTKTLRDGRSYTIRSNRDRFFFPDEWMKFYDTLKHFQKITFNCAINLGARINEIRNVRVEDIDLERKRLILRITKIRAKKKEKAPRPRVISISTQFSKYLKGYIAKNDFKAQDTLKILSTPAANLCLKGTLKKIGIKDYYMFSTHNIRKTHGNWLKALGVEGAEICSRLGHDYNTFLKSYVSPDVFSFEERGKIRLILGDLYQKKW